MHGFCSLYSLRARAQDSEESPGGTPPADKASDRGSKGGAAVITISDDDEGSPVPSDGEQAVSAVKSRTRTAAQLAGINIANSRRARFAQKYAGLTAEQTLGA